MDIVRPVIKMKMRKYGGGADGGDIRFNLLALVDDHYQSASDELELLKREKIALERRLDAAYPDGWSNLVRDLKKM
jgi:ubiquitin carboxyl-terminal hydrolase L5